MGGPVVREQDVLLRGSLKKQSRWLRQWRPRWTVLTGQFLCTYEYQGEETLGSRSPTEFLVLRECQTVRSAEDETGHSFAFRVDAPGRTFFLVAENKEDKERWIGAIGKALIRDTVVIETTDK
jgi:hypothetical protein